jgi:hypothetical protein
MDSNQISYIVALLFAVAVLVILIVILARNSAESTANGVTSYDPDKINTKVNWLYYINLVEVGLIVIFGLLGLFAMRRWCMLGGNCSKA